RERATDHAAARGGLQASEHPLIVYSSSQSHSSVEKAALLAGFGRDNLRVVAVDDRYSMSAEALRRAVEADQAAGRAPCAVVATVGSTSTTAVDPLEQIASVARAHGLWLHVDAAMAGSAMILPECRPRTAFRKDHGGAGHGGIDVQPEAVCTCDAGDLLQRVHGCGRRGPDRRHDRAGCTSSSLVRLDRAAQRFGAHGIPIVDCDDTKVVATETGKQGRLFHRAVALTRGVDDERMLARLQAA